MKLNSHRKTQLITFILRLIVGGAFAFAGVLKMADPAKFANDITNYRILPHEWTHLVAIILPGIETVAGFLVLTGIRLRPATWLITGLTLTFLIVIVSALVRGLNIECGCFGTIGGKHIGLVNLVIDSTLLCLSLLLIKSSRNRAPPSQQRYDRPSMPMASADFHPNQ